MNKGKHKKKSKKNQKKKEVAQNDDFFFDTLEGPEPKETDPGLQNTIPPNENQKAPPKIQDEYVYYNQKPVYPAKYTDSDNSEDEGLEDYKISGYHPVHVGEVLLDRYIIMQKLGWGHFSTAWLAKDTKYNTYVAIKIQKSAQQYIDAAYDEVEILQELEKHNFDEEWVKSVKEYWKDQPEKLKNGVERDHSQIVQLLNSFIYHGQNGKHFCMVFEIMGVTLLEIIKRYNYKGIPLPYVREITKQILIGLDFLHRMCGIIHTDLKPENVLVCLSQNELKEIYDTGYFDIAKLKNKNDKKRDANPNEHEHNTSNVTNTNTTNLTINKEDEPKATGKKLRKKNQKYKRRQIKKLEKQGLSQEEIDKTIEEIMLKRKKEVMKENAEKDIDLDNFNIDDIVDRPRIASVPKYNLNTENEKDSMNDDEEIDDPTMGDTFDFDIMDYSKSLQMYIKERNRVMTDMNYRKELLLRNKMLKEAKTEKEKELVIKTITEKMNKRGPEIDSNIKVKICDMGNACWFSHHFSTEIQTRQYRSPEVILGVNYNETADLWSLACMVFELVTGDFLFEPRKGDRFTKNDDHIAQFIELLGKMPKKFALSGCNSNKYFTKQGQLRRIKGLQYFYLKDVLTKKYKIKPNEAKALADFLLPMLEYYPEKRASAREMLNHPWLKMKPNFDYMMSDWEVERMNMIETNKKNSKTEENEVNPDQRDVMTSDDEVNEADDEDNDSWDKEKETGFSDEEESGDENPDKINIPNFNNSFAQYGQFVDLAALDRANPQFENL